MDFGVSQILATTFAIVKDRFGGLVGIWAIYFAISIGLSMIFGVMVGSASMAMMSSGDPLSMGVGMVFSMIVFYVIYILVFMAQTASLNAMSTPVREPSFADAFNTGFRSALPLLGLVLVLIVAYILFAIVAGVVGSILSQIGDVGSAIFAILLIPAMIFIGCRLSLVLPVVAVEGQKNPVKAIARSWELTEGHVLSIFLACLVFAIAFVVALAVLFVPFMSSFGSLANGVEPAIGLIIYAFIAFVLVMVVWTIAIAALQSVMHGLLAGSDTENLQETFE